MENSTAVLKHELIAGLKGKGTQSENAILSYFLICIFKTKGIDRLPNSFLAKS